MARLSGVPGSRAMGPGGPGIGIGGGAAAAVAGGLGGLATSVFSASGTEW